MSATRGRCSYNGASHAGLDKYPPSEQVRSIACQSCNAEAGKPCVGYTGKARFIHHAERSVAYIQAHDWRPK